MSLSNEIPSLQQPVSLAEAKLFLRLDHSDEDALLAAFIATAARHAESATGLVIVGEETESIPAPIRTAILMHVAQLYEHREIVMDSGPYERMPHGYDDLLRPYRTWSF